MTCLLWTAGRPFLLLNAAGETSHPTTPKPTLRWATRDRVGSGWGGLMSGFQAAFPLRGCGLKDAPRPRTSRIQRQTMRTRFGAIH